MPVQTFGKWNQYNDNNMLHKTISEQIKEKQTKIETKNEEIETQTKKN